MLEMVFGEEKFVDEIPGLDGAVDHQRQRRDEGGDDRQQDDPGDGGAEAAQLVHRRQRRRRDRFLFVRCLRGLLGHRRPPLRTQLAQPAGPPRVRRKGAIRRPAPDVSRPGR